MSRNVRNEEKNVIFHLKNLLSEDNANNISNCKKKIFFSEETYKVIEKADIRKTKKLLNSSIVLVRYDAEEYICILDDIYLDGVFDAKYEVVEKDICNGIGILLLNNDIICKKSNITELEIIDRFLGWDEEKEFFCEEILEVYNAFRIFKSCHIGIQIKYEEDLNRLFCWILCKSKVLNYDKELCENIYNLLELESSRSVTEMIVNIFQTENEKMIFHQLYRCLEYLYIIQRALGLATKYSMDLNKVLTMLSDEKMRYAEYASIKELLIEYCDNTIIQDYFSYLVTNCGIGESDNNKNEKIAEYIYDTRCKIAHFKYGQDKIKDELTLKESNNLLSRLVVTVFQSLDDKIKKINIDFRVWNELWDE